VYASLVFVAEAREALGFALIMESFKSDISNENV
jgi:hypothetical protein